LKSAEIIPAKSKVIVFDVDAFEVTSNMGRKAISVNNAVMVVAPIFV
jgi:hypothetical protein